jgi:hypothetical protein
MTSAHVVEQQMLSEPLLRQCPWAHSRSATQGLPSACKARQTVPEQ